MADRDEASPLLAYTVVVCMALVFAILILDALIGG